MTGFRFVVQVLACAGISAWACLGHAQTSNPLTGEVLVEWDHSRRSPINPTPFARPAGNAAALPDSPESVKENQGHDTTDKTWTVLFSDGTVRRMLQRWADDAGYQLLWDVPRDFPIEVEMSMSGKFRDVVWTVIESLSATDFPVQASVNPQIRLIRVVRHLESQAR